MSMAPFYNGGREGEHGTGNSGRAARKCAPGAELGRVGGEKAAFCRRRPALGSASKGSGEMSKMHLNKPNCTKKNSEEGGGAGRTENRGQRSEEKRKSGGPLAALRWLARRNQGGTAAPALPKAEEKRNS